MDWIHGREYGSPFYGKETPGPGVRLSSAEYLRSFLQYYLFHIAYPIELPVIVQAHHHALHLQTRELIALDRSLSEKKDLQPFAEPSRRIGLSQMRRFRPLRDQRLTQRYLQAVESNQAFGWHPIVYAITLSIYSFPIRQGLSHYLRKTMTGFMDAASGGMDLGPWDHREIRQEILEEIQSSGALQIRNCIQAFYDSDSALESVSVAPETENPI